MFPRTRSRRRERACSSFPRARDYVPLADTRAKLTCFAAAMPAISRARSFVSALQIARDVAAAAAMAAAARRIPSWRRAGVRAAFPLYFFVPASSLFPSSPFPFFLSFRYVINVFQSNSTSTSNLVSPRPKAARHTRRARTSVPDISLATRGKNLSRIQIIICRARDSRRARCD